MNKRLLILLFLLVSSAARAQTPSAIGVEKQSLFESEKARYLLARSSGLSSSASTDIDITYYFLKITLSTPPGATLLTGDVRIDAISLTDTLTEVILDLMNTMKVDSVFVAGHPASYSQQSATLTINLDRAYASRELITLRIVYHGIPVWTGFGSFLFSSHNGTPWVWSLSEPYGARDWWPCKDHPSDKADSSDVWITCDAAFKAGSNGRLIAAVDNGNGTRTWKWSERYPIANYLISIAVTNYDQITEWFHYTPSDSMPVIHFVLPELTSLVQGDLHKVLDALSIYSDLYGLYPFIKEKYGHAWMGQGGAMEHQTMTSTTSADEMTIVHELAHQWFGDMITCRTWTDLWLNEGFATYSEALYAERRYGADFYHQFVLQFLNGAKKSIAPLRVQDTTDVKTLFDQSDVYFKGAAVLHMLRHVLGDSVFFRCMRSYAADPQLRYNTASSDDFKNVCERVSGRSLAFFFDEWLDGTGYPAYTYSWTAHAGPSGWTIALHISQKNGGGGTTIFAMPMDVHITGNGLDTIVSILNSTSSSNIAVVTPRRPLDLQLDPRNWLLADMTNLNSITLPKDFQIHQSYPNPFNPSTVIPFELPGRTHVSLIIYNVIGEEVARLIDGQREAGYAEVEWDGLTSAGRRAPSGVYFYSLTTLWGTKVGKMILAK